MNERMNDIKAAKVVIPPPTLFYFIYTYTSIISTNGWGSIQRSLLKLLIVPICIYEAHISDFSSNFYVVSTLNAIFFYLGKNDVKREIICIFDLSLTQFVHLCTQQREAKILQHEFLATKWALSWSVCVSSKFLHFTSHLVPGFSLHNNI